jgi:hypothetical protein
MVSVASGGGSVMVFVEASCASVEDMYVMGAKEHSPICFGASAAVIVTAGKGGRSILGGWKALKDGYIVRGGRNSVQTGTSKGGRGPSRDVVRYD